MEEQITKNDAELVKSESNHDTNWTTDATDLLFDLKSLMKDYYVATFTEEGDSLKLCFNNGQSFIISIKACA